MQISTGGLEGWVVYRQGHQGSGCALAAEGGNVLCRVLVPEAPGVFISFKVADLMNGGHETFILVLGFVDGIFVVLQL